MILNAFKTAQEIDKDFSMIVFVVVKVFDLCVERND